MTYSGRIVEHVSGESVFPHTWRRFSLRSIWSDSSAQGLRTNDVLWEYDSNTFGGINDDDPDDAATYSDSRNVLGIEIILADIFKMIFSMLKR